MGRGPELLAKARENAGGLSFAELQTLAVAAGFVLKRTKGSHHMYSRQGVRELVNLQADGKDAKAYQVRQVVELIDKYGLEVL
jgi:predicted RNA binding protein YcfA (HicA-like mRNA interferase family)